MNNADVKFEEEVQVRVDVRIIRILQWGPGLNPTVLRESVMVNFMCQIDWATVCPGSW